MKALILRVAMEEERSKVDYVSFKQEEEIKEV